MSTALLLVLAALVSGPPEPNIAAVDPDLSTVASTGFHRLVVFRECSPEHCWAHSYLQWFDPETTERKVVASTEVKELGYGTMVESAKWVWSGEKARLEVQVIPSHGEWFKPFTLTIYPGTAGAYTTSGEPAHEK